MVALASINVSAVQEQSSAITTTTVGTEISLDEVVDAIVQANIDLEAVPVRELATSMTGLY
jgi:flagellar hook-basal body complex protein FliE